MWVAGIKAWNETEYIYYVLKALEPFVDRFVIVEGCTEPMMKCMGLTTSVKESTDGMPELVRRFMAESSKPVIFRQYGVVKNENFLWNAYLKEVDVGDILWSVDADEYYEPENAKAIVELVNMSDFASYRIPMLMFWHDFHHLIRGGNWDCKHERIVRISEGCYYRHKSDLVDKDGNLIGLTRDFTKTCFLPYPMAHFSYVRDPKKIVEKQVWQLVEYEYWGTPKVKNWLKPFQNRFKRAQDFITKNFSWFNDHYDDREGKHVYVQKFERKLGGCISEHPYAKLKWDEDVVAYTYPRNQK